MRKEDIESILQIYPLQYHKHYHTLFGSIEQYPIIISRFKKRNIICIQYAATIHFSLEQLTKWKEEHLFIEEIQCENHVLTIYFQSKCKHNEKKDIILLILQYMQKCMKEQELLSYCSYCRKHHTVKTYILYDQMVLLCNECYQKLYAQLERKEPLFKIHKSTWKGMIASCLGGLLGVFLWYFLYQFDFFAPIASFILTFGIWKGYILFTNKINKYGIAMAVFLILVMIVLAQGICLTSTIYHFFKADETYTFLNAIQNIATYLQMKSIYISFIKDICMGYAIAAFTSYTFFVFYQKESKLELVCLDKE